MMAVVAAAAIGLCAGCDQQDSRARSDVHDLQKKVGDLERSMTAQQAAYRADMDQLRTEMTSIRSAVAPRPAATDAGDGKKTALAKNVNPKKKR
jgi:phage-related tail protein